jgi:hypothetical protein
MALTDTLIRQLKPKNKAYSMNDIDGLSLFIAANGRKSWHFRFSWQRKQSRISFGTYPEINLKDARRLKEEARSQIAKGIDPRNQRPQFIDNIIVVQEKQCITFAEFSDIWKQFKLKKLGLEKSERRQSTKIQIERYLHKDMLPILGQLPLDKITREHVLQVQRKIEKRGALSIAEKCRSWLNEMFRHAIAEGIIHGNPASDLDIVALPQNPTLHNPFLRMDELPLLLQNLKCYQGAITTKLGIQLLLLTGVRTGELRQAEPKHFDLDKGIWEIPADAVKQLKKRVRTSHNKIPSYIVPLST